MRRNDDAVSGHQPSAISRQERRLTVMKKVPRCGRRKGKADFLTAEAVRNDNGCVNFLRDLALLLQHG
jgi:hypothetical protein